MEPAYKPIEQNPPGMLHQGVQKEDNCCYNTFCWIFQLAVWALIGVNVTFIITRLNQDSLGGFLGGLGVFLFGLFNFGILLSYFKISM